MRIALKEWAIVVEALGSGEQTVILRAGGLRDGRGSITTGPTAFLLFPTQFHQQRDWVVPSAQARYDQLIQSHPDPARLEIRFLATVAACQQVVSVAQAERLRGQHIWRDDAIRRRFNSGKDKVMQALALRVYRLPGVAELAIRSHYGGCKSWVELDEDIATEGAEPVLDDAVFADKLKQFHDALELNRAAA